MRQEETHLKPIFSKIKKKTIWALDTEDNSKGEIKLIVLYDGKKFYHFTQIYDFITFLFQASKKIKRNVYITTTNLEYDIVNAFKGYYNHIEFSYGQRLISARLKGTKFNFIDSLNHYKISVKEQGDIIGLKKLPFDPDSKEYCERDTEITGKFMEFYQNTLNDLGCELKNTIASSSLNYFRRQFLNYPLLKPSQAQIDFLRKGYYGGRSEIFNMELEGDIYYYDVNSLYPSVMLKNHYPNPNTIYEAKDIDKEGMSYAEVEYIKDLYIPYLPVHAGKLIFPTGTIKGHWSNFELRYGIEKGFLRVKKIYSSVNYKGTDNYFEAYVKNLYNLRLEYKKIKTIEGIMGEQACKIMLNSLYGKFAEHVEQMDLVCSENEIIKDEFIEEYDPTHCNMIFSIYTTAYARTVWFEGATSVYNNGGKLGYGDTDSIIYAGKQGLVEEGDKLGQWKLEGKYKYARFFLPKTYLLIDNDNNADITAKGIPYDRNETLQKEYIKFRYGNALKGEIKAEYKYKHQLDFLLNGKATFKRPIKFKESQRRKDKQKANVWIDYTKSLSAVYDKRIIDPKTLNTRPLNFPKDIDLINKNYSENK